MISLTSLTGPKNGLSVWLICWSFYNCLLLLVTRFWFLWNQLRCPESTKRLYLLSCKWLKCSLSWSWRGFSWCLRPLNSLMTSLFSHFDPLLHLQIRNSWILPFSLVIIILVLYLFYFVLSCSLKWSYFARISNRFLYLLIIICLILHPECRL